MRQRSSRWAERIDERTLRYQAREFGEAARFFMCVLWLAQRLSTQETLAAFETVPGVLALKCRRMDEFWYKFATEPPPFDLQAR